MIKVKQGDSVKVVYDGMLENKEIFESSEDTGPLEFRVGSQSVLPGFENAIIGMSVDEIKTIQLQPEEAYGIKRDDLIHTIKRESLGKDIKAEVGMVVGLTVEQNNMKHKVPALITNVTDKEVTVDFNHPLAGQVLTYIITVKEIIREEQ